VVHPYDICGFRATEPLHCEAQLADNGNSLTRAQLGRPDAAMDWLCDSRRARLSAFADYVALPRHRVAMPSKERLAANADSHAELASIIWMDH